MKNSLVACLILCFSLSFAQLSVSNNTFVYVTDQVLFVTDDVNIEDVDSKIYLRDEAQLLQGSPTTPTGNSGLGELSVYQNSEVNHFAYHYWCSPVGGYLVSNVVTNNNLNNAFQINLIDDPLLGTPDPTDSNGSAFTGAFNGTISPSLTISRRWLWTYVSSSDYLNWIYAGDVGDISAGLGFTMKGMGPNGGTVNQTYDFRGKPNTGTITNSIAGGEFTLIGNPYPSALDAADFLWDTQNDDLDEVDAPPTGTTGAMYYWEQDPANSTSHVLETYVGGYASYTCTKPDGSDNIVESFSPAPYSNYLSNGLPTGLPTGMGGRTARRYVPIGQGFMVEGAAGIPGGSLVYLENNHRNYVKESAGNSEFFRNSNQNTSDAPSKYDENGNFIVPDDYKRFRVIVSFNELYSRELLANFHISATDGFDYGLEAKRPNEVESDAYWTQNDEAFVIQANSFDVDLKIPLVIDVDLQQPIAFGIYDIQNFESDQEIYIHDLETDTYANLKTQNYFINIEPGHYTDRFEIVFTSEDALDVDAFDTDSLIINQNNGLHQLFVLNPKSLDITSIEVYDVAGKRLLNANFNTVLNRYELSTTSLGAGVYIVNVKSNTNAVKSQKIIVKN